MLLDDDDYDSYFEDTMKAGHYENNKESVDIMIRSSQHIAQELVDYGVDFQRDENGNFEFTREGAHSENRILFHEDLTGHGKPPASCWLAQESARTLPSVRIPRW